MHRIINRDNFVQYKYYKYYIQTCEVRDLVHEDNINGRMRGGCKTTVSPRYGAGMQFNGQLLVFWLGIRVQIRDNFGDNYGTGELEV